MDLNFTKLLIFMRRTDKAALVDTVNWTSLSALAASCTKSIINNCKVINHLYSAVGTGLLTLHTADTAVRAIFTYLRALIVIRALDCNASGIIDNVNY